MRIVTEVCSVRPVAATLGEVNEVWWQWLFSIAWATPPDLKARGSAAAAAVL